MNVPATLVVKPHTSLRFFRLGREKCVSAKMAPPVMPSGFAHTLMSLFVILLFLGLSGSYSDSGTAIGSKEAISSIPRSHTSPAGVPGRQMSQGDPAVSSTTGLPKSTSCGGSFTMTTSSTSSSSKMFRHFPSELHWPVCK